jgi:hypothetical protein
LLWPMRTTAPGSLWSVMRVETGVKSGIVGCTLYVDDGACAWAVAVEKQISFGNDKKRSREAVVQRGLGGGC